MRMHTQEKSECPRSPHTSLSLDESAAVQIHLEFNSTRKHFCHIFIRKLIFSLYRREKEMHICLPNQNAKTFDRANKEGGTGGREKGRKGGGRGEKGGREKGERGEKGEKEEGEQEGGRKGEGEGRKGPPPVPLSTSIS